MSEKSVIIIGAGIAGLAVGCYARMNGYRTHIFEMHEKTGGLCTAWERKGYTIDGHFRSARGAAVEAAGGTGTVNLVPASRSLTNEPD